MNAVEANILSRAQWMERLTERCLSLLEENDREGLIGALEHLRNFCSIEKEYYAIPNTAKFILMLYCSLIDD